eukprot:Hpha_TRINITY_DN32957_c0_g1::TRINITY_DN32957_c0_g1_i1::g.113288::m.113288
MGVLGMVMVVGGLSCPGMLLEAGHKYTCYSVVRDGTLRCVGFGLDGVLGTGDTLNTGKDATSLVAGMTTVVPVTATNGEIAVKQLSCGSFNCVVIGDTLTEVKCWGNNAYGVLGTGDLLARGNAPGEMAALNPLPLPASCFPVTQVAACEYHVCILCSDSITLYCLGDNTLGQLGVGDNISRGGTPGWSWSPTDLGGVQVAKVLRGPGATHTCII